MSFNAKQVTVGTAAVQVLAPMTNPAKVILHNGQKSGNHYIFFGGDSSVTTGTGAHLDPAGTYEFTLSTGNQIWAVCSGQDETLHVIWQVV